MSSEWDQHFSSTKIDHGIMQIWADYFVDSYQKYFGFSRNDVVLDFGAGLGDVSFLIKDKVQKIYLFDKSDFFLDQLKKRFVLFPHIRVVHSLPEIKEMLVGLQSLCDLNTRIIISDIVPAGYSKLVDGISQLLTGLRKNFFKKLLSFMVTNILDDPKLSLKTSSFYLYDEEVLKQTLSGFGYAARRMGSNFSYSKYRYTLFCTLIGKNNYREGSAASRLNQ